MIIQTGMRTDIPAFYPEWLINRIKEEYVLVRNPYNPVQVTRYSLSTDVVLMSLKEARTRGTANVRAYWELISEHMIHAVISAGTATLIRTLNWLWRI